MPQTHILRLLAARRAATSSASDREFDDEGPFFDLDFSSCSVRASSYSSGSLSLSDSDSDDSCADLDFTISLHRTGSASEPPTRASSLPSSQRHGGDRKRAVTLRTLSFGARRKAAPLHGFPRSSSGRHSFARSSTSSSARSFRLFADSPRPHPHAAQDDAEAERSSSSTSRRAPSRDVFRRCLAKISRRLRTASASPRGVVDARGLRRLRKCRSASCAAPPASSRDDDSAVEKQDGIAGAIAHCKDSLHRVASECDSPLLRSRSDPGKCEAAA